MDVGCRPRPFEQDRIVCQVMCAVLCCAVLCCAVLGGLCSAGCAARCCVRCAEWNGMEWVTLLGHTAGLASQGHIPKKA